MKKCLGILLLVVTLLSGITVLARDTNGSMTGGQKIKVQLGGSHRHRHHHRRHWRRRHNH